MGRGHERRGLDREYLAERRRAADDPRPDPDEQDGACPFGWAWCDPNADLADDGAMPCFSCHLRQDRENGGPHSDVDPETGDPADEEETGD